MSKRGALKSKYSCAVHSDFYCFASADICRHGLCTWPPALHTQLFVDRCAAMKSECTINVTSFQYKWQLMVRSYFHRCTSADVFRHRSMSPFIARLGIVGHWSMSIVDRCTAMKSERTIMVRSDFHRFASANVCRR